MAEILLLWRRHYLVNQSIIILKKYQICMIQTFTSPKEEVTGPGH